MGPEHLSILLVERMDFVIIQGADIDTSTGDNRRAQLGAKRYVPDQFDLVR